LDSPSTWVHKKHYSVSTLNKFKKNRITHHNHKKSYINIIKNIENNDEAVLLEKTKKFKFKIIEAMESRQKSEKKIENTALSFDNTKYNYDNGNKYNNNNNNNANEQNSHEKNIANENNNDNNDDFQNNTNNLNVKNQSHSQNRNKTVELNRYIENLSKKISTKECSYKEVEKEYTVLTKKFPMVLLINKKKEKKFVACKSSLK